MLTITEFIQEHKFNIDIDIFDLLFDIVQNNTWLYVSGNIIHEWIGHKKTNVSHSDFYKKIIKAYVVDIDYKEVTKDHDLVLKYTTINPFNKATGGGALRKYYIISDKTLVICLMKANTSKSTRILEYFYQLHDLLLRYHKYQSNQLQLDHVAEINMIKIMSHNQQYTIEQAEKYINNEDNKSGYVYFIHEDKDLDYFKIGFTINLEKRLCTLQGGNRRKLNIYKSIECINYQTLENILHKKFKNQNILNEWFKISISDINELMKLNFQESNIDLLIKDLKL